MAIEHADFEGIERLAAVLGAEIVSTFDNPEGVKIGKCDLIEEIMIGEDKVMRFSGVQQGQACTEHENTQSHEQPYQLYQVLYGLNLPWLRPIKTGHQAW